ncbi:MAG: CaiB/BaiF CoA transferase family protein [Dehalococcoidia bacterium]
MEAPLSGIKVLEVANFLVVPSAGALMADMGADVVKVEPPGGDPYRQRLAVADFNFDFALSYGFELDNRGKRSIVLDLKKIEAQDVVRKLAEKVDVFLTNLLPRRQERYRLRYRDLSPLNPGLVYLSFSGYGSQGPEKDRPGFDYTAFWTRSGAMSLLSDPDQAPAQLRPGFGDHASSPLLLAGVLAALLLRERTGKGQEVSASLLNMGLWVIGSDVQRSLVSQSEPRYYRRTTETNPLRNTYLTKDNRWINIVMLNREDAWTDTCKAVGREDLVTDPRYGTPSDRAENCEHLIRELDEAFASMTLEEMAPRLDAHKVIWAPKTTVVEALADPQVESNGYFTTVEHPTYGPYKTLDTPLRFSHSEVGAKGAAPEVGQHTEQVLLEFGYSRDDIAHLRAAGAIN